MRLKGNNQVVLICQPLASFQERLVEIPHHEVNNSSMSITNIALVAVAATVECEAGMLIRMERTQGLMVTYLEPQGLSDLLDWQVLKLLDIETV